MEFEVSLIDFYKSNAQLGGLHEASSSVPSVLKLQLPMKSATVNGMLLSFVSGSINFTNII